jgi:hypothetical protein
MRKVGEDVTETLDYIPGRRSPAGRRETMAQTAMPSLSIDRRRPGPGLLAYVLVSKYCDHPPLYRQAQIYARKCVDLDRADPRVRPGQARGWSTGSARPRAVAPSRRRDRRPCYGCRKAAGLRHAGAGAHQSHRQTPAPEHGATAPPPESNPHV